MTGHITLTKWNHGVKCAQTGPVISLHSLLTAEVIRWMLSSDSINDLRTGFQAVVHVISKIKISSTSVARWEIPGELIRMR